MASNTAGTSSCRIGVALIMGLATGDAVRVVIDSNRVQSDELALFLAASRSNRAVVTDWLMMEAYKGDTLRSIHRSLGVLARFPRQVVVLRNTGACLRMRVGPQMANRLIWREHTHGFASFIGEVAAAREGDALIADTLLWRGERADERMADLEQGASDLLDQQRVMLGGLSRGDVDAVRGRRPPAPGMLARILAVADAMGDVHRAAVGLGGLKPVGGRLLSDFPFRVGVAMTAWLLERVRTGSTDVRSPARVRNDYVDAMLAAFGTYYNGVMSRDRRMTDVHAIGRGLLAACGATLPPECES